MERKHVRAFGLSLLAAVLTATLASAQEPAPTVYYEAPTAAACESCAAQQVAAPEASKHSFLSRVCNSALFVGPNGGQSCERPFGCSTFRQEACFMFGSCNQFFGKPAYNGPSARPFCYHNGSGACDW